MSMEKPRARFLPTDLVDAIHEAVSIHVDVDCSPAITAAIETSLLDTMYAAAEAERWQFRDGFLFNMGLPQPLWFFPFLLTTRSLIRCRSRICLFTNGMWRERNGKPYWSFLVWPRFLFWLQFYTKRFESRYIIKSPRIPKKTNMTIPNIIMVTA